MVVSRVAVKQIPATMEDVLTTIYVTSKTIRHVEASVVLGLPCVWVLGFARAAKQSRQAMMNQLPMHRAS